MKRAAPAHQPQNSTRADLLPQHVLSMDIDNKPTGTAEAKPLLIT